MKSEDVVGRFVRDFGSRSGIKDVEFETKPGTAPIVILKVANPTDRLFDVLQETVATQEEYERLLVTIRKRPSVRPLLTPEARAFSHVISESLTISRHSFGDDFFSRYTRSVSNAEEQIVAAANHVVYGRRGAGKSSLLLYCMRTRERDNKLSLWIDMQAFERRSDDNLIADILEEILEQFGKLSPSIDVDALLSAIRELRSSGQVDEARVRQLVPRLRRVLGGAKNLFIFLDDFHVLQLPMQSKILSILYSVARGNNIFLKLSAIESMVRTWDSTQQSGLQVPHDAQTIKLDYNLTMPDKASSHIQGILDAHARYTGLPSVRWLCSDADVISRLVWVSAGVPRDALNLFALAMSKGTAQGRKRITVSHINLAASEMVTQKLRDIGIDLPQEGEEESLRSLLEDVKDFCIKKEKNNAFLLEIDDEGETYVQMRKLIDLRLIHVISEGITVGDAGRKFLGLILDYGFYTGIRAAQSVELFNRDSQQVSYKDLRALRPFRRN